MVKYYENYIFINWRESGKFDIEYLILEKNSIYYDLLKIKNQKNLEINTSVKIMKLTKQMISKS